MRVETAVLNDLDPLQQLEQRCFTGDRLSRRSMRRFISSEHSVFLVMKEATQCLGYLLIIFHRGTRLARLYSLAVDEAYRGKGIARQLIEVGEAQSQARGALYFRLEVNNKNSHAITLYESLGFKEFGLLQDYYEDHSDALRMQKRIRVLDRASVHTPIPWYQQQTEFTCGPAALMMAMAGLNPDYKIELSDELEIWREATTIFMTSGHGGCHPLGLALAATKRGFKAEVWISQTQPLFVEGVRSDKKKQIIEHVHNDFVSQAATAKITVNYQNIDQLTLSEACSRGAVPIVLISTYRLDRKKSPHWVAISGHDERCFYLHDPYPEEKHQDLLDCQYMPIAREDFEPMSAFGSNRLRTCVMLSRA